MIIPPLSPPAAVQPASSLPATTSDANRSAAPGVTTVDISRLGEFLSSTTPTDSDPVAPNVAQPSLPNQVAATTELQHVLADEALQAAISDTKESARVLASAKAAANSPTDTVRAPLTISPSTTTPAPAPVLVQPVVEQTATPPATATSITFTTAVNTGTPIPEGNPAVAQGRINAVNMHFAAIDPSVAEALAAYHLNDGTFGVAHLQVDAALHSTLAITAVDPVSETSLDPHDGEHSAPEAIDTDGHRQGHSEGKRDDEGGDEPPTHSTIDVLV